MKAYEKLKDLAGTRRKAHENTATKRSIKVAYQTISFIYIYIPSLLLGQTDRYGDF